MALAKEDSNGNVSSQEKAEEKEVKPSGFKCYMVGAHESYTYDRFH